MKSQRFKNAYMATVGRASAANLIVQRVRYRNVYSGLRLNLGSGGRYLPGLLNVDVNVTARKDLWLDIRWGLPFVDGSVDAIYMCHVLEHFSPSQAISVLEECHRVLKVDGGVRLVVPSLDLAIQAWGRQDLDWFPTMPDEFASIGGRFNNYLLCRDQHRMMLDASFLRELLTEAGFSPTKVVDRNRSCCLQDLLPRIEPSHDGGFYDNSLIMEGLKSNRS